MNINVLQNASAQNSENEASNFEYHRRRLMRNARKRERRQQAKEVDPDFLKVESEKREERRQKQKSQNPESHAVFLQSEKQKRENEKRQIFNDIFDSLFHENKHTFPTPVSKTKWEELKKKELDYLFSDVFSPGENTAHSLMKYRKQQLEFLLANPNHPCAASIIFYIKTMVHRPKDQRKLTIKELDWIRCFVISSPQKFDTKKYERKEYKKEKDKEYYERKKSDQKTYNLNIRFMKADPNKVLSVNDIISNPFVSNFPQREEFKINLWKRDKNPEYLEKWKKQREIYEKEVEDLSIEYKENFVRNKWLAQS